MGAIGRAVTVGLAALLSCGALWAGTLALVLARVSEDSIAEAGNDPVGWLFIGLPAALGMAWALLGWLRLREAWPALVGGVFGVALPWYAGAAVAGSASSGDELSFLFSFVPGLLFLGSFGGTVAVVEFQRHIAKGPGTAADEKVLVGQRDLQDRPGEQDRTGRPLKSPSLRGPLYRTGLYTAEAAFVLWATIFVVWEWMPPAWQWIGGVLSSAALLLSVVAFVALWIVRRRAIAAKPRE
jgi:hypothetical protein